MTSRLIDGSGQWSVVSGQKSEVGPPSSVVRRPSSVVGRQQFVVVSYVLVRIVSLRGKHHKHAVARKSLLGRPDLRRYVERDFGSVQPDLIASLAVVE